MRVFRAVEIDQRWRRSRCTFAGETVHQFGKKGFADAGGAGQQNVQPVGIQHRRAAFFHRIAQAAIVTNQAGKGIVCRLVFLNRQQVGNGLHFTLGLIQFAPQQRFNRLTMQKEYRAPAAFNRQAVVPELIEIFTDRVARQSEVKADSFRCERRFLRQMGKIQSSRQPFQLSQYYLNPSHLFTA